MDSVKLKAKEIVHKHCSLADKVVPMGVRVNTSNTTIHVCLS